MPGPIEYRCRSCKSLLFKGLLVEGGIEAKCKKCHALSSFTASAAPEYLCLVSPCPHRIRMDGRRSGDIPKGTPSPQ